MTLSAKAARGLTAISPRDIMLTTLAVKSGQSSEGHLLNGVRATLDRSRAITALDALAREGLADRSGKPALTDKGAEEVERRFGKLPGGEAGAQRLRWIWPALALGLDPKSKAATRLVKVQDLRAVALAVLFDLPVSRESATLSAVNAALILRGLTGLAATASPDPRLVDLVRRAGNITKVEALRNLIVKAALAISEGEEEAAAASPVADEAQASAMRAAEDDVPAFVAKVQTIADRLSTPPFAHKVAIAQIYDVYGREHRDAGSIETFKSRLLAANGDGLVLYRLDDPDAIEAALRERSRIDTRYGQYHFVGRS
jgi:hypothetical protein